MHPLARLSPKTRGRGEGSLPLPIVISDPNTHQTVSATPVEAGSKPEGVQRTLLQGEPILHFEGSSGKVKVELPDLDSLLDTDSPPSYPHTKPMLNGTVAKFMLDTAREDRGSRKVEITITFRDSPLRPEEEAGTRAKISSFFANEVENAELAKRVNRVEAWGSLRYALPVVAVAAVIAGLFANPSSFGLPGGYVSTLAYLIVVVIIWVMVWDPIEKLLFDSYFIRLRIRALQKLVAATIVFGSRPGPSPSVVPAPIDPTALESIHKVLEG
jgi:hypothetical protein